MPLINKPTRISIDSCTLIDNIFTNDLKIFKSGILINDLNDHLPIFTILSENKYFKQRTNKYSYKRQNAEENLNSFRQEFKQFNWEQVTQCEDVNEAYDKFVTVIKELYNKTCPVKKVKGKKQLRQPWLSNALINACKNKRHFIKGFSDPEQLKMK